MIEAILLPANSHPNPKKPKHLHGIYFMCFVPFSFPLSRMESTCKSRFFRIFHTENIYELHLKSRKASTGMCDCLLYRWKALGKRITMFPNIGIQLEFLWIFISFIWERKNRCGLSGKVWSANWKSICGEKKYHRNRNKTKWIGKKRNFDRVWIESVSHLDFDFWAKEKIWLMT